MSCEQWWASAAAGGDGSGGVPAAQATQLDPTTEGGVAVDAPQKAQDLSQGEHTLLPGVVR